MEQYGSANIYKLTLTGKRDPDIVFDEAYLKTAGRIISFTDATVPAYDIEALRMEHRHDLIGDYIDAFLPDGNEASLQEPIRRQAFFYGLDALLSNLDSDTGEPK